ncbi:MAG: hypothetical protein ACFFDT_10945, partial [Candidatus Hodarchaeota archaeon]
MRIQNLGLLTIFILSVFYSAHQTTETENGAEDNSKEVSDQIQKFLDNNNSAKTIPRLDHIPDPGKNPTADRISSEEIINNATAFLGESLKVEFSKPPIFPLQSKISTSCSATNWSIYENFNKNYKERDELVDCAGGFSPDNITNGNVSVSVTMRFVVENDGSLELKARGNVGCNKTAWINQSIPVFQDFIDRTGELETTFNLSYNAVLKTIDLIVLFTNHTSNNTIEILKTSHPSASREIALIEIQFDYLAFMPTSFTEHYRSRYHYTSSYRLEHTLSFENYESRTTVTIFAPPTWNYTSITPNCSIVVSENIITLAKTAAGSYEIRFTSGKIADSDKTRILPYYDASKEHYATPGFEEGNSDWDRYHSDFGSTYWEGTRIFDGNHAYRLMDADCSNDTITNGGYYNSNLSNGTYALNFEYYFEEFSGTGFILSYYNESWIDVNVTTTPRDCWLQFFQNIHINGTDSKTGANLRLRFWNASGTVIIDSFNILKPDITPQPTSSAQTTFVSQWRSFDGRQNPVVPNAYVNFELQYYPNCTLLHLWDYRKTDLHGIAKFNYRVDLQEGTYKAISAYWDSIEAPKFNSGFITFSIASNSEEGHSWELHGAGEGWEVSAAAFKSFLDVGRLQSGEIGPLEAGDNEEDYVDNINNNHDPADIGIYSSWTQMQATDGNMNTLTEFDAFTNTENDYDSSESDVDSSADMGTESNPFNAQGTSLDTSYMTVQETASGSEWLDCNAYDATYDNWTTVGTSPYLDVQDEPANIIYTKQEASVMGWFDFPSTTLTGTLLVNISVYCRNDNGEANDYADIFVDFTGTGAGTDVGDIAQHTTYSYDTIDLGVLSVSEVNNLRVYLNFTKVAGTDEVYIDHIRIGITAIPSLKFEYQWTTADHDDLNEEVCIFVSTQTGIESLNVSYWDSSGWTLLGQITSAGWTNLTATGLTSATYTIQLNDAERTIDANQDQWEIDLITLHTWTPSNCTFDREVAWTAADFDEVNEFLCIKTGMVGSETLLIDVWDTNWVNIGSIQDANDNVWVNISISTYLIDTTIEFRFVGSSESGDGVQDSWEIDAVLLHAWSNGPDAPSLYKDSGDTFADKEFTIQTIHTDPDGAADLNTMHIRFSDGSSNITLSCPQDTASGSATILSGSQWLNETPTYSHSAIGVTNGYNVTWTVSIDWNWTADDAQYTTLAQSSDDMGIFSDWAIMDTDNSFENDLIVKTIQYSALSFPDGIEEGGGSTIDDNEATKGGIDIVLSGVVCYQGAPSIYPNTDAVDVVLNIDGVDTEANDTELGVSGEFSLPAYTISSLTDSNYDYNITLIGWSGSGNSADNYDYAGSEAQTASGVHIDSQIDND